MIEDHRHCVVCGKVIPVIYTKPEEPPLCSLECRAKWEEKGREFGRQRVSWFTLLFFLAILWLMIVFLSQR
ncbi:MAG: DUF2116 family Zn-ribbon domain-containing protein [Candidatus Nezhaarchaeales archaeon]